MGLRDLARKGLGLLVELPEEPGPSERAADSPAGIALRKKSIGELMTELDNAPAPSSPSPAGSDAPPVTVLSGEPVQFDALFQQAGVPPLAFTAEQALELIHSLPADLALETKRKTVGASLTALGRSVKVSRELVLLDAQRKLQALAAYEDAARSARDAAVSEAEQQVQKFQAEINEQRRQAAEADAHYRAQVQLCEAQGHLLSEVQEFLTLDEPPSVHAS